MEQQGPAVRLAASSDPDFAIWKAEASVVHFDGNWTPPDGVADKFDSLSTVRLPKDLIQYKLDASRHSDRFMKFVRELQNWCKDNGGPENTKTDPNSIVSRLSLLFSIFSDIRQRCYHDMRECDDGIGRNIDSLLQLVFGDLHYAQYRIGETLRLRRTAHAPTLSARTDRLLVIQGPKLSCSLIQEAKLGSTVVPDAVLDEASWEDTGAFRSIIAFPVEFRRKDDPPAAALNQLVVTFVTAQHQRRALGLPDQPLFGMLYDYGALRILSASWDSGVIHIYHHDVFMVPTERDFMATFFFLCNLRDYITELYEELDNLDATKTLESLLKNPWRARALPPAKIQVIRDAQRMPGIAESEDGTIEEVDDYDDEASSTELGSGGLAFSTAKVLPKSRQEQSDRPAGLIDVLKQWVKSLIFYYLGVLVGMVHDRLG